MLSDDCLVIPGAICNGYKHFEEELNKGTNVGAMAFYWRNWPEQKKYVVGLTFGNKIFVNHGMYLKNALEDVDYIDEESFNFYHADGDLCLKMWKKGYVCIDSPDSFIEHYSHANLSVRTTNFLKQKKDWDKYLSKWDDIYDIKAGGWIEKEYYDVNLTIKKFGNFERKKKLIKKIKSPFKHGKNVYKKFLKILSFC
jgi:GT2 family glycosyltransferase